MDTILVLTVILVATSTFAPGFRRATLPHELHEFKAGQGLTVSGIDWGKAKTNVVLILAVGCQPCERSYPFYSHLAEIAKNRPNVRMSIGFFGSQSSGIQYSATLGAWASSLEVGSFRAVDEKMITVPSIAVTDSRGVIAKSWSGHFSKAAEDEVVRDLAAR
ncbi:MAG: hypothetical protein ABSF22_15180 [Bryobacteraceae bacterium]